MKFTANNTHTTDRNIEKRTKAATHGKGATFFLGAKCRKNNWPGVFTMMMDDKICKFLKYQ